MFWALFISSDPIFPVCFDFCGSLKSIHSMHIESFLHWQFGYQIDQMFNCSTHPQFLHPDFGDIQGTMYIYVYIYICNIYINNIICIFKPYIPSSFHCSFLFFSLYKAWSHPPPLWPLRCFRGFDGGSQQTRTNPPGWEWIFLRDPVDRMIWSFNCSGF